MSSWPRRDRRGLVGPEADRRRPAAWRPAIDELDAGLPELRSPIYPTGTPHAASLHLARAVCHRAERRVTTLRKAEAVSHHLPTYLNRLADLHFVPARYVNSDAGILDRTWVPSRQKAETTSYGNVAAVGAGTTFVSATEDAVSLVMSLAALLIPAL